MKESPISEQVLFARLDLGGLMIRGGGGGHVASLLFHFAEQGMQFGGVADRQGLLNLHSGFRRIAAQDVRQRKIVAVRIMFRINLLGYFEVGDGRRELALLHVKLAQVVAGGEAVRRGPQGGFELGFKPCGFLFVEGSVGFVRRNLSGQTGKEQDGYAERSKHKSEITTEKVF